MGIGASAGGLAALKELLTDLPIDSGMAFVLLQHRALSQPSLLSSVLASASKMPVLDIRNGQRVEPNHIYVVPPGVEAALYRGALTLRTQKDAARRHLPIDALFCSLAKALHQSAIAVVLSGTASDGTEGLRVVRDAGGITFAQDPDSAEYDGMPRSAIAAGVADFIFPPREIARRLGRVTHGPAHGDRRAAVLPVPEKGIDKILSLLRNATGVDFTHYKRATIERRLARRLAERKAKSLDHYADYLAVHPAEASVLYEDLLIHVTEFFRDGPALNVLATRVLPELVANKPVAEPIRVWVPGCSTGQEVYSLAILLLEQLGDHAHRRAIQIFGTDLSERAIETARAGRYPASIADQVSDKRLQSFFNRSDGGWRINKDVRERCVFVRHDLLADPPFSRIDLLSCRNVLIYFSPALQRNVIPLFHYALNQPGFLMLGRSESVAGFTTIFSAVDPQHQIYARRPVAGRTVGLTFPTGRTTARAIQQRLHEPARSNLDVQHKVDHILLARYAPACVLIDADLEIQQFRGHTGSYLEPAPGRAHFNLLKMAREGLLPELRLAIQRAQQDDVPVRRENILLREGKTQRRIQIEVIPVRGLGAKEHFFLVLFIDNQPPELAPAAIRKRAGGRGARPTNESIDSLRLRQELAAAKEYLQSLINQQAGANEELALANEELLSGNEELQSTNEELATAKEEMESTNEELATVNDELRRRNHDLMLLNDDLVNLLAAVDIAIIIVDNQRQVRRFTPKARAVVSLIASDVGRAISDLKMNVDIADLDQAIAEVIQSLVMTEIEVNAPNGVVYRMQIRPYRTSEDKISGAVVSFVDITTLKLHLEEARTARDYAAAIVEAVPNPLVIVDEDLRVRSGNPAYYALVGRTPHQAEGHPLQDLGGNGWLALRQRLEAAVLHAEAFDDIEVETGQLGAEPRVLHVNARPLPAGRELLNIGPIASALLLIGIVDITDRRRAEMERARLDQIAQESLAAQAAAREKEALLNAVSHELRAPLNTVLLWTPLLRQGAKEDTRLLHGIDAIERSVRAEAKLVDDLVDLSLSRHASGQLSFSPESVDPRPVIAAALDVVRAEAETKSVALDCTLDSEADRVWADPSRLQQIASCLFANAIKFTSAGGRITISLKPRGDDVELRVRDQGRGIRPDFIPRLFEPFSQEDRSITRSHGGLGIGLALVHHLVERHNGTIVAESAGQGQGATFTVRLPATAKGQTSQSGEVPA